MHHDPLLPPLQEFPLQTVCRIPARERVTIAIKCARGAFPRVGEPRCGLWLPPAMYIARFTPPASPASRSIPGRQAPCLNARLRPGLPIYSRTGPSKVQAKGGISSKVSQPIERRHIRRRSPYVEVPATGCRLPETEGHACAEPERVLRIGGGVGQLGMEPVCLDGAQGEAAVEVYIKSAAHQQG